MIIGELAPQLVPEGGVQVIESLILIQSCQKMNRGGRSEYKAQYLDMVGLFNISPSAPQSDNYSVLAQHFKEKSNT